MNGLIKLAAIEVGNALKAIEVNNAVSDSLCDIKMYIDDNKSNLPDSGEIPPSDLLPMITDLIKYNEILQIALDDALKWNNAIIELYRK